MRTAVDGRRLERGGRLTPQCSTSTEWSASPVNNVSDIQNKLTEDIFSPPGLYKLLDQRNACFDVRDFPFLLLPVGHLCFRQTLESFSQSSNSLLVVLIFVDFHLQSQTSDDRQSWTDTV